MAHDWRVDAWGNHDGAAGDLLGTVLHGPLGLEFADMKTIIDMAREAGLRRFGPLNIDPELKRFAELVRADEREAILDLVDSYAKNNTDLADAIRARGNT